MAARKAQLAHYENTRAQFEDFAANGWANHKMSLYWMLNNQWPSFFGSLFDYYLKPGGAYYGAKKGLRPLSVVFDYFATGDRSHANFTLVNQTPKEQTGLRARIRIYDLEGKAQIDRTISGLGAAPGGTAHVLTLPRPANITPVYFVRCELFDAAGVRVLENVYWQSTRDDVMAGDGAFNLRQDSWADMTALNSMPSAPIHLEAHSVGPAGGGSIAIRLENRTAHVAFFERAEIAASRDGDEILPIEYDDNYITVFPGETEEIHGEVRVAGADPAVSPAWVRLRGYNTPEETAPIR